MAPVKSDPTSEGQVKSLQQFQDSFAQAIQEEREDSDGSDVEETNSGQWSKDAKLPKLDTIDDIEARLAYLGKLEDDSIAAYNARLKRYHVKHDRLEARRSVVFSLIKQYQQAVDDLDDRILRKRTLHKARHDRTLASIEEEDKVSAKIP